MPRVDLHAHLTPAHYVAELERRSVNTGYLKDWSVELTVATRNVPATDAPWARG
jgi:hypothetical protein